MNGQRVNPLWWGGLAAVGVLASEIYSISRGDYPSFLAALRLLVFVVFLALLILKSRFAWHTLGVAILVITPVMLLVSGTGANVSYHGSNITFIDVAFTVLGLVLFLKSRKAYFGFVSNKQRNDKP